ncbi:FecCD family ABC transporter permease [Pseudobutyrivibrio sp.]|uniref:FecCD family ABC transporter permease n=1 Tax=Pseudobutyrivibrio sp. TaxID=2014367 RepID=UPI0025CF18BC|nr:iron ABC transporter permease [Pseudobutyrivibrio sp.]MBR5649450.1 iron ABC transporter permease [Pseudobutyrivibrio sp.]
MNSKKTQLAYIIGISILILALFISITYGVKSVGLSDVIDAFIDSNSTDYNVNIVQARIPRSVFGLIAGAALSISGLLMQSITKNPIADPSILGVNTGASLFIVIGITFFNLQSKLSYIGVSFIGAIITALFVYKLASAGYGGPTPIKLAIAGAATSTALSSFVSLIVMPNSSVMTTYRFWQIGSIGGTSFDDIKLVLPFILIGIILSILLSNNLDTILLSEDTATALGLNVNRTKAIAAFSGVLLCATVTALAGPISFVGLMVPHIIRMVLCSNHLHLICLSGIYGASILLISDVLGRILGRPGELETGIMTAIIGGPIFIIIIRKAKVQSL